MEASDTGTMDPEGAQTEGGVQTTTTTTTEPLADGQTAQEQATGDQSQGGQPPDAPGQDPAQGDEAKFEDQQAAEAAAQSPAERQTVPEQRPQAFSGAESVSDASKRLDKAVAPTEEGYERANSDEAKEASIKNSRTPNLVEGQRVQILEPNSEAGRMAYVLKVVPSDGIQGMLAASGTPEARFAELSGYVVRTRDGRSDILEVKPEEVKPLDDIQGWGRGQI